MTEFRISDNGIGISKQDIIKLFKQFPDIPQEGGVDSTGLGLSICKGIIVSTRVGSGQNPKEKGEEQTSYSQFPMKKMKYMSTRKLI